MYLFIVVDVQGKGEFHSVMEPLANGSIASLCGSFWISATFYFVEKAPDWMYNLASRDRHGDTSRLLVFLGLHPSA